MKLAKSVLTVALGLGLVGLAQPAQAAKRSHTIPTTFRHTWYAYDHGTYDRLTLKKHSAKGIMLDEDGVRRIWMKVKGQHLGIWSKGRNKATLYSTVNGFKKMSEPLYLTHSTTNGHAQLHIYNDGYHDNYYRTKSVAYRYR